MSTYQSLCLGLIQLLKEEQKTNRTNIVAFVKKATKLLKHDTSTNDENKVQLLVDALKQVAKGNDGIFGTDDDLISREIIMEIQQMSKTNLLTDLVTIFVKRKKSFASSLMFFFKCYHAFT